MIASSQSVPAPRPWLELAKSPNASDQAISNTAKIQV